MNYLLGIQRGHLFVSKVDYSLVHWKKSDMDAKIGTGIV
jgi:hypothetical protein